eukprot:scaffold59733_cov66-Phaeocystis_antarctica.AAC.1
MAVPFPRSRGNASYAWEARAAEQKPRRARRGLQRQNSSQDEFYANRPAAAHKARLLLSSGGSALPP